jgi:hypothetical protein
MCRWFANHPLKIVTPMASPSSKRPRATNAELVFGEEQKATINERINEGGNMPEFNIAQYNSVRKQLFKGLSEDEKHAYEEKATRKNESRKGEPDRSIIAA